MDTTVLVPIAVLAAAWATVKVIAQQRTWREAHRVELQAKLLERVGSAREFGEFLASPAGERFLQALAPVEGPPLRSRLFFSIRSGTFFAVFALMLLAADFVMTPLGTKSEDLRVVAVLTLAVGIAFLASAALSLLAARRLGLDLSAQDAGPKP